MDGTGNDVLLKTTKVTEWSLNHGGYVTLGFGGFLLLGSLTAYVIAVARGNVDPFLPLISDAAGSPPQNGLFGTFVCLGGMFGVVFMILRYMIVQEKNRDKSSLVTAVNKLSLFVGIFSMLGITLVTGYPINFYRNRDVWLRDVGLPHMIGGVMLFALGLVYIALQCVITLFLKTKNQLTLFTRILLLFICTAAFVYHMITVPENLGGISHLYYINNTDNEMNYTGLQPYPSTLGANLKLPIDTSGTYISSAITEWILVIFFCCFFFTFFNEAEQYSLLIVIETHNTKEQEAIEETKVDPRKLSLAQPQISNQVVAKPAPEVRKFLRRDSTCQTITDTLDRVIIPTKDAINGVKKSSAKPLKQNPKKREKVDALNGTKKILTDAEIDAKLKQSLNGKKEAKDKGKEKESEVRSEIKEEETSVSTECKETKVEDEANKETQGESDRKADREAERIAVEKIDVVVKDAEASADEATKSLTEENEAVKKNENEERMTSVCSLSIQ